ncbi:adhesion G-protein coupled receptor G6-like [Halichondria panicea]|uniref:adhesion G-protein coupled receptor G6-like n=1 Tax=Halichondria panicea TaxID=6063 RepID=UPI00312B8E3C
MWSGNFTSSTQLSPSSTQQLNVTFTFVTNSAANCSTGLSHTGVFVLIEYRLLYSPWKLLKRVSLDDTGSGGCFISNDNVNMIVNDMDPESVQLRIVQPEHSGGLCNCWGVKDFSLNGMPLHSEAACDSVQYTSVTNDSCSVQFCGGSASVPRGVVFPPVILSSGTVLNCSDVINGSAVTNDKGPPPTTCSDNEPKINLSFELNLLPGNCESDKFFDEGVEVSVGNWENDGQWIPLKFFASSLMRPPAHRKLNIDIDPQNIDISPFAQKSINIRGYTVPIVMQNNTNPLYVNFSVCGNNIVRSGVQFRWLQTASVFVTSVYGNDIRDVWTMNSVSTSNPICVSKNTVQGRVYWSSDFRNSEFSDVCSMGTNELVFGATCVTNDCFMRQEITASRIATTVPLNVSMAPPLASSKAVQLCPTEDRFNVQVIADYEATAREELATVYTLVRNNIETSSTFQIISNLTPAQAARALRKFVTQNPQFNETVVVYLLSDIVIRVENSDDIIDDIRGCSDDLLEVATTVIASTITREESNTIAGSTLLDTVERIAFNVLTADVMIPSKEQTEVVNFETQVDSDDTSLTGIDVRGNSIRVPTELVRMVATGTTGPITVASVYYRNMSGLLPGTLPGERDTDLASPVVSTSLQCGDKICDTANIQLSQPVIVTLKHSQRAKDRIENDTTSEVTCVFWQFIRESGNPLAHGRWDTEGCVKNGNLSSSTQTVCECTHLTNFAILLSARPLIQPSGVALSLSIIGYIGVSLSVIAMLATIMALVFLRTLWNMRNYIHINLCVSLILAQLTFVIGVTPHGGEGVVDPGCQTAAVLMHYLFLVSFMWMLMEGVVLYLVLVKVFVKEHERKYIFNFTIVSYGAPVLYMALCIPLGFALSGLEDSYGYQLINSNTTTIVCWLNPITNFILTFIVPVVVILLVNVCFFIMAIVIMCRHQTRQGKSQEISSWLKSSVSLVTVMGLTWITGLLVFDVPALLPVSYIFTIFASFQGVAIFILFVPLSLPVRDAYFKWWKEKLAKHRYQFHFKSTKSAALSSVNTNVTSPPLDSSLKLESNNIIFNSTMERESGTLAGLITWRVVTTSPTHHTLGLSLWVVVGKAKVEWKFQHPKLQLALLLEAASK